jgi:hypothetical protein
MAKNTVYTESVITLNNQDAMQHLDELRAKAEEIRTQMSKTPFHSKEFNSLQKQLLKITASEKDINEGMKRFQATMNNLNGASINELQSAARKLNSELRKLSPNTKEFTAAANQLKKVRDRMNELNNQSRTAQKTLGGFFTKIGWAGMITGAIALIKKFGSDMIAQTQLVGDQWQAFTGGMKDAYGAFVADLSSGKGWNQLVADMKESYANGVKVRQILDEIFERNNSLSIEESEKSIQIEKYKQQMRDVSLTDQERIDAAQKAIDIENKLADKRKAIATDELGAAQSQLQTRTHMTNEELDAFIKEYNNNRDLILQAQEYNSKVKDLTTTINSLRKTQMFAGNDAYTMGNAARGIENAQKQLKELQETTDQGVKNVAETVDKYNLSNDEMVKNYVDAIVKLNKIDADRYSQTTRMNTTLSSLRQEMAREHQSAAEKAYKEELAQADEHTKEMEAQAKEAYANGEYTEEMYNAKIASIQQEGLQQKIAISERYKQSTIDYQNQILDLTVKQAEKVRKFREDMEKDVASINAEAIKQANDEVAKLMDEIGDETEREAERLAELMGKAKDITDELHPVAALEEQRDAELAELDDLNERKLISEEDYQAKRKEIIQRYAQQIRDTNLSTLQDGLKQGESYLKELDTMTGALQQAATARLDAQMQKELTAAGDNEEEREKIEEKYEKKKLSVRKKYANADMAISIAKTVANGAQAIVKTFAELGWPAGIAGAAIMAVTTAAQIATIIAQRNAIMNASVSSSSTGSSDTSVGNRVATGYAHGGYTKSATNDYQEVGVVHANEWVAPAAMVRANPVTFARLESARVSGNYSHSGIKGFADGGATTPNGTVPDVSISGGDMNAISRFNELMTQILQQMPLKAYVVYSDINAATELDNKIKSIVGKK